MHNRQNHTGVCVKCGGETIHMARRCFNAWARTPVEIECTDPSCRHRAAYVLDVDGRGLCLRHAEQSLEPDVP